MCTRARPSAAHRLRAVAARAAFLLGAGVAAAGTFGLLPGAAAAHPLAPSLLSLEARGGGRYDVLWKTPAGVPVVSRPEPVLPERCRSRSAPRTEWLGSARTQRFEIECGPEGLQGARIGVRGLRPRGAGVVVRVVPETGRPVQVLVTAAEPFVTLPSTPSVAAVVGGYLALGARHLVFGIDHVLFVSGLLLLVRRRRALLLTVSGFTLGHSLTLALVALGWLRVPAGWVEVAIAGTLLVLAAEIVPAQRSGARPGWLARHPAAMASAFGLLHGLGFAGALSAVGLPRAEVPLALLSFNVGIELGQLAWIGVLLALGWLARPWLVRRERALRFVAAYGMGSLAAWWAFERAAAALAG